MKSSRGFLALVAVSCVLVFGDTGHAIDNSVTPPIITGMVVCNEDYTQCEFVWDPPNEVSEFKGNLIWNEVLELADENEPIEYLSGFQESEAPFIDPVEREIIGFQAEAVPPATGDVIDLFRVVFNCPEGCMTGEATFLDGGDGFIEGRDANDEAYLRDEFSKTLRVTKSDYNSDGMVDVRDLNELQDAIKDGMNDPKFDFNGDSVVDTIDLLAYVHDPHELNTWIGDSNLDGEFDSIDIVEVFVAGEYEDGLVMNSLWQTGDWNADREFDSSDFVLAMADGGYEVGPRPAGMVPEPSTSVLGMLALCGVFTVGRRRLS